MARCGICPQGTIWRAESTYVELGLARIQPPWWFGWVVARASPATSSAPWPWSPSHAAERRIVLLGFLVAQRARLLLSPCPAAPCSPLTGNPPPPDSPPATFPAVPGHATTSIRRGVDWPFERAKPHPGDALWAKPEAHPRIAAALELAGAPLRCPADVAGRAPPLGHCQWPPRAQLTGLTQSTADWAGPVTDMRAPPQKLKKRKEKENVL